MLSCVDYLHTALLAVGQPVSGNIQSCGMVLKTDVHPILAGGGDVLNDFHADAACVINFNTGELQRLAASQKGIASLAKIPHILRCLVPQCGKVLVEVYLTKEDVPVGDCTHGGGNNLKISRVEFFYIDIDKNPAIVIIIPHLFANSKI